VRCNQRIKFSALSAKALALGFDTVATGHHARLSGGRLRRAVDRDKDQSYVLAVLTAEQLRHAAFPIGDTPKPQIRAEAARRGLAVASPRTAPCWPPTTGYTVSPSGSAKAWASPGRDPMAAPAT
jgi:tRNA U34 2-thiouridine synthase MnmA/TrmU